MRAILWLLGFALAIGCAAGREPPGERPAPGETATLRVVNLNWSDVRVHIVRGASRVPLGTVTTGETKVFTVPRDVLTGGASLRLFADPIGSRRVFVSQEFRAEPGQVIEWRIRNLPQNSSVTVN